MRDVVCASKSLKKIRRKDVVVTCQACFTGEVVHLLFALVLSFFPFRISVHSCWCHNDYCIMYLFIKRSNV